MRKMLIRDGQEYVEKIFEDRNRTTSEKELYPYLLEKYKLMLEELWAFVAGAVLVVSVSVKAVGFIELTSGISGE